MPGRTGGRTRGVAPDRHIPGIADSKAVPAEERADLQGNHRGAVAWAVAPPIPPKSIASTSISGLRAMARVRAPRAAAGHRAYHAFRVRICR
jgi:hypothetical protein